MSTILLVEDNEDDVFFMERARTQAGIENPMAVARNGQEALDYLQGAGKYTDRNQFPLPFLVLLDLKLPFVPGLQVLKWIREQPEFQTMLVIILTASKEDRDIDSAYRLGANSYLVKPPTPVMLTDIVKSLGDYWMLRNQPPVSVGKPPE
ncbi:MAG: response regulator receiver protein [Pedosphaera sp.]|nr:response regulator receiver protein [Pedosphaera sp.]